MTKKPYLSKKGLMNHTLHKTLIPSFKKLDASLIDLLESLKDQPEHVLNKKINEEKWSVLQVIYHLILTEEASINYCKKKLSFNPELKKAGIVTYFRRISLMTFVGLPFKFKAPEMVSETRMPKEMRFWELVKKWKNIRQEAKEFLGGLPPEMFKKEVYKHPAAGRLTLTDMVDFWEVHFRRHRKQIKKIMSQEGYIV